MSYNNNSHNNHSQFSSYNNNGYNPGLNEYSYVLYHTQNLNNNAFNSINYGQKNNYLNNNNYGNQNYNNNIYKLNDASTSYLNKNFSQNKQNNYQQPFTMNINMYANNLNINI